MKTGSLYIVYNDINDKVYVGITVRKVHRRFHEHIYAAEAEKDNFSFIRQSENMVRRIFTLIAY